MKKIASIFFLIALMLATTSVAFAQGGNPPIPDPPVDSFVLDTLDWLNPAQEDEINTLTNGLDEEGLAQIAVVTLDDCGSDKQLFRNDLFREWGIGHKDDNDGLLILVCWQGGVKGQRSLEQEVGYGLEAVIPDLTTSQIAEKYYVPFLKAGNESEAINNGEAGATLVAMVKAYDEIVRNGQSPESGNEGSTSALFWTIVILIVLLIVLLIVIGVFGGDLGGGSYSGGSSGGSFDIGSSGGGSSGGGFGGGSSGGGGSSTGG